MNSARAPVRAWCGRMKHKWLRDGVTTVVPTMIKHQNGHDTLRRLHCSKVTAMLQLSEQSHGKPLPRLLHWEELIAGCNQRTGTFFCRMMELTGGSQNPHDRKNASRNLDGPVAR